MFVREIKTSLDHIKGIGKTTLGLLAKLGLVNITDLLCYYPRDYEDRSHVVPIQDFQKGNVCTIAHVVSHKWFGFGAMKTLKVNVEDETGRAVLVCFNRPFLENKLIPNTYIRLWGHFFYKYGEIQSSAFEFEETAQGDKSLPISKNFGSILPVYRLCAGLSSGALRNFIKTALSGYAGSSEDELPENIIEKE
ncbi:MAG: ATP-dependent DNA helicase RecG, partial [Spirochaetaceae bacterium]|nr:ATP-dependent DNA helicase RecG [Spirochaetaceae bacterium]